MFSGIVEEVGEVIDIVDTDGGRRLKVRAGEIVKDAAL